MEPDGRQSSTTPAKPVRWPVVVVLYAVSLLPIAATAGIFVGVQSARELGFDIAASLFGPAVPGTARLEACEGYVEQGRYRYTGERCRITIVIDGAIDGAIGGAATTRIVDLSDAAGLQRAIAPSRIWGRPALAMSAGFLLDRLRGLVSLLVLSALGAAGIVSLTIAEYRLRRERSRVAAASGSA